MIDQISLRLHGVRIKLKITQHRIALNTINIQIILEFLTEDGRLVYYTYYSWRCCLLEITDSTSFVF